MAFTFNVPLDYGYVLLATAGTFWLGSWHGIRAGGFRRSAGIKYPQLMASPSQIASADPEKKKAMYVYNCAQRAHGNYLENQPSAALSMLIAGLIYPRATAVMGLSWIVMRAMYAVGYTRADKDNGSGRYAGILWILFQWGLQGMAAWTGYKVLTG